VPELAGGRLRLDAPAEHVARLTIDSPAKRNALDHEILDALAAELPRIEARCLIVTGRGPVFSAGYDIGNLTGPESRAEAEALVAHPFQAAIEALDAFPFPVVAALNGPAIGGGLELAVTCDLRLAADGARLGMPPARLGLVYSHTGLRRFLDLVGPAHTRALFFTARAITAERALAWGLVDEVVPREELPGYALEYAARIAANAPLSLRGNKRVLRALEEARAALGEREARELVDLRRACFASRDFAEGVRAFAEKREPRWTGE
jgi:enoyl-CoA hydratase/carnithine racemase